MVGHHGTTVGPGGGGAGRRRGRGPLPPEVATETLASGAARSAPAELAPPIEDHALLGDTRTAALVTRDGTLDWLCVPRFDSPPVFGSLLGGADGGRFSISPVDLRGVERSYREGSAVLETTWATSGGRARLTDAMVTDVSGALLPQLLLVRRVECMEGSVELDVCFDPRRDLRERPARVGRRAGALICEWGSLALSLQTRPDLDVVPGREQRLRLRAGESMTFVLGSADRSPVVVVPSEVAWTHVEATDRWWRRWSDDIEYEGPSKASVVRSLITLRLLTYAPSGAPVAAPTTSLPETVGGERNWDYRFAWPRDASLGTAAFLGVGKPEEAETFFRWLAVASRLTRPSVQVLYDLDGRPGVHEDERFDVPGFAGSLPVRIGNAACDQHQLDVYGWIVDGAWQLEHRDRPLARDLWAAVRGWADSVCRRWREPDAGIWERRDEPQHYVHSKLFGWQALDRALTLAQSHRIRPSHVELWRSERDALAQDIRSRGHDHGVYTQRYGAPDLDAALLLLPDIGFEPEGSPRVRATVEAVATRLSAGGGLLYRYLRDNLSGREGAFLACSFWHVRALSALGRRDQAGALFESLCARGNDVGLLPEQIDPSTGAHLGNFPQALTHSSLVLAAQKLREPSEGPAGGRASTRRRGARPS